MAQADKEMPRRLHQRLSRQLPDVQERAEECGHRLLRARGVHARGEGPSAHRRLRELGHRALQQMPCLHQPLRRLRHRKQLDLQHVPNAQQSASSVQRLAGQRRNALGPPQTARTPQLLLRVHRFKRVLLHRQVAAVADLRVCDRRFDRSGQIGFSFKREGMLALIGEAVPPMIEQLAGDKRAQVAVLTFDRALHFYKLGSEGSPPKVTVSPDLANPIARTPDKMLVRLSENKNAICDLFRSLEKIHAETRDGDSALGDAMATVKNVFAPVGGKICVFSAATPSVGVGRLHAKMAKPKDKKEVKDSLRAHLIDNSSFYSEHARSMNERFLSVDVFKFALNHKPMGCGSLGALSHLTGGSFKLYEVRPGVEEDFGSLLQRLSGDLRNSLLRPIAWDAVMRIRASHKLLKKELLGDFDLKKSDLMSFPVAVGRKTVSMTVKFDDEEEDRMIFDNFVFFQSALLFTSQNGDRRIRVYNLAVPVTNSAPKVAQSVNTAAFLAYIAKMAVSKCLDIGFETGRNFIQSAGMALIRRLALSTGKAVRSAEDLPPKAREMAAALVGLLKSEAFCDAAKDPVPTRFSEESRVFVSPIRRFQRLCCLRGAPVASAQLFARPLVFPLLDVLLSEDYPEDPDKVVDVINANAMKLNSLALVASGVLVISDGQRLIFRVKKDSDSEILEALFGVSRIPADGSLSLISFAESESVLADRLGEVIGFLRKISYSKWLVPEIMVESQNVDRLCAAYLYEERSETVMSLDEFLKYIVKVINTSY
ncbi:Protein transport protein Sec24B, variant 2 [Bonamia ostreae]|uniref:Protein transport protein Sec24B, variant 2 n=1 Tax=Bonamia ostreae TaxID=126728 RepID=A0ABV2AHW4_9EUKA